MYQVLINSGVAEIGSIAVNMSKEEYEFFDEATLLSVDLYDTKVSAKSYNGQKFVKRADFMRWLHKLWSPKKSFEVFMQLFSEDFENYKKRTRIANICTDILYEEYNTGAETAKCFRRIGGLVNSFIDEYGATPTKPVLRKYIRFAMRDYILND